MAGVAAEVHRHLCSVYGLDVAAVARSTRGVRPTTCSTPIVGRERRWKHHASPWGIDIVRPRTARMLSGRTLKPLEEEQHKGMMEDWSTSNGTENRIVSQPWPVQATDSC